jgi:hypothetical protein
MAFDRVYSHSVRKELGIQVDQTIKFTHQQSQIKYPGHLRRIKFHNREKDKTFIFLTNHFDIEATTIAGLYKERWKIEFFRWIKQHLKIKSFYGTSENAIHCQIWIAICTYLLVAITKKKHCCPKRFSRITNFTDFTGFKRCKNAFCDFDLSFI